MHRVLFVLKQLNMMETWDTCHITQIIGVRIKIIVLVDVGLDYVLVYNIGIYILYWFYYTLFCNFICAKEIFLVIFTISMDILGYTLA